LFPVQKICMHLITERLANIALSSYDCDLCVAAATGQGKTIAYLLPIVHALLSPSLRSHSKLPVALIVLPTRDLALQVASVAAHFSSSITTHCLVGEHAISEERALLARTDDSSLPSVIVATLGRLTDHLLVGSVNLSSLVWLVVDEADRMLSQSDLDKWALVLRSIPDSAQRLLFSATMTSNPMKLNTLGLKRPLFVSVNASDNGSTTLPDTILHKYMVVPNASMKTRCFLRVLEIALTGGDSSGLPPVTRCLVLCKSTEHVGSLLVLLRKLNKESAVDDALRPAAFSGNLSTPDREKLLAKFASNSINCLISTDLITRGIDIPDIDMVVNFDVPSHITTYVHRAGRTGRAGKPGTVVTLCEAKEARHFRKNVLEAHSGLKGAIEKIKLDFKTVMKKRDLAEAINSD
jgi:ATP-dependent RNA helicase DDX51/DBP6